MTNEINNFSFTATPEATASFHNDGVVILHTGNGTLFSANQTGARIWRALEQQLQLDAIVQQLSREYQIALTTARAHTLRFLNELQRHELVQQEARS